MNAGDASDEDVTIVHVLKGRGMDGGVYFTLFE